MTRSSPEVHPRSPGPGWLGAAMAMLAVVQLPEWIPLLVRQRILLLLIIAIGALFLTTVILGVITVLLRFKNVRTAAKWDRMEEKWEPEILRALAGEQPVSAVWEHVAPDEGLYFVDLVLRYARQVRGAERVILRALAEPYLQEVAGRSHGADAERRARAVQTLGELGLPQHADVVVAALDDSSPLVAMIAARALARRDTPEYAEAVLSRLHRFTSWRPSFLSSMLTSMGPQVAPALRRTLADRAADPGVRAIAASGLRQLNDLPSAEIAAAILESESGRDLLAAAVRLLQAVGRPEHLPILRRLLHSDDFVVRATAVGALGSLGDPSDLVRIRQAAFEDESQWVAITAARALKDAGGLDELRELAGSGHRRASVAMRVLAETEQ